MKNTLLLLTGICFIITSCKSESSKESVQNEPKENVNTENSVDSTNTNESKDVTIFTSTEMGVKEYLKLVVDENKQREWYYWTEEKPDEVKLGVIDLDGLEGIYFFSKPDEVYEIGGSECGFSLFLGSKRLQWYQQIKPSCEFSY
ncbi:MAG: hypothetical protein ACFHU9_13625 [Fluviicola sp.]